MAAKAKSEIYALAAQCQGVRYFCLEPNKKKLFIRLIHRQESPADHLALGNTQSQGRNTILTTGNPPRNFLQNVEDPINIRHFPLCKTKYESLASSAKDKNCNS